MTATIDGWVNLARTGGPGGAPSDALRRVGDFFGQDGAMLAPRQIGDLLAAMDAGGMERGLLAVGLVPTSGGRLGLVLPDLDGGLAACAASNNRLRLTVMAGPVWDPLEASRGLRRAAEHPEVVAVLVGAAGMRVFLNDPKLYPLYTTAADLALPVVANVGIFGPPMPSKYQDPMLVEEILCDFPTLTFIAAHMGHPWERLLVRLMMKFPNLHLMTSAYLPRYLDQSIVDFMNSSRGAGRVCFGSDWPVLDIARAVGEARQLPLSAEALDGYLGGNLGAVLKW